MRRGLGAVGAALLLFLLLPGLAMAHAELVRSEPVSGESLPDPPAVVRLTFSEPVEVSFSAVEVYAADRARADEGSVGVAPDDVRVLETRLKALPAGTYVVVWRALSLDGHVIRGSFAFGVGAGEPTLPADLTLAPVGPPAPVMILTRWLTFFSAFTLLGGFSFALFVLAPSARTMPSDGSSFATRVTRAWVPAAWTALAILLATSFLSLLLQAADATGVALNEVLGGRAVTRVLTATRYGAFWLARVGLLVLLGAVLAWLTTAGSHRRDTAWWVGLLLSAGVLLTISASGHASTAPEAALAVFVDWLHLLGGGVWIGGLIALRLALPGAGSRAKASAGGDPYAALTPRFSRLALVSVGVLIPSGLYASLVWVPGWNALLDTAYGAALSGKLLLLIPLLIAGAVNLLLLRPRLVHGQSTRRSAGAGARPRYLLRTVVLAEIALAAGVIAVTAILAGLPPARTLAAEGAPFSAGEANASRVVTLGITPNRAGSNAIRVEVIDSGGVPVEEIGGVTATLSMQDMDMGTREVALASLNPGVFETQTNALAMAGRWSVRVQLHTPRGPEQVDFQLAVGAPTNAAQPFISPLRILRGAFPSVALGLAALLVGGYVQFLLATRVVPRPRPAASILAAGLMAGGFIVSGSSVRASAWRSLPNPVVADEASLARGQAVYASSCAACHGERGRGDGPAGARLVPRPADFRVHLAAGHTDRELFQWISEGVDGTAMPAFRDRLSERERWDVVNYIRTLAAIETGGAQS